MKSGTQQTSSLLSSLSLKLFLMLACLGFPVMAAQAQMFITLHSFTNSPEGANPQGGLIVSGNMLYGSTVQGGSFGAGTVFRINTDGTGLTNLHSFSAVSWNSTLKAFTNSDGGYPATTLVLSSNTLYGTTSLGGPTGNGTVFSLKTDGSSFTNPHGFTMTAGTYITNGDGAGPVGGLTLSGDTLYGITGKGGTLGGGVVFAINTAGAGFTNLYNLVPSVEAPNPQAGLTLSGNMLYGTTTDGGNMGFGSVFGINTDGLDFTNLHEFSNFDYNGVYPVGGLIVSGNTLYGTTEGGGGADEGVVFRVNTDGSSFTNLHNFTAILGSNPNNSDGGLPYGGNLVISGSTLYGVASAGGNADKGTVFSLGTDGTHFKTLHSFSATAGSNSTNSDGTTPICSLLLSGNRLYGLASSGGSTGNGTLFCVLLPGPQLTISTTGTNVVLTWPTNTTTFSLEVTTNLGSAPVWTTNSTTPVIIGDQNAVTNAIAGTRKFYRLISQ